MANIKLCEPVEFTFKKYEANADDGKLIHENERRQYLIDNYKIEIPETKASQIVIEIEIIEAAETVSGDIFITDYKLSDKSPFDHNYGWDTFHRTKTNITFWNIKNDFKVNTILIDCYKPIEDTVIKISCLRKA